MRPEIVTIFKSLFWYIALKVINKKIKIISSKMEFNICFLFLKKLHFLTCLFGMHYIPLIFSAN
jgi:hypothetical protein